jgi:biopolymer transport protein ExbB/TolQ
MGKKEYNSLDFLEKISFKITQWIGTPTSIMLHTLLFVGIFFLEKFGVKASDILLILTTAVSLEAIYLAIFIQMSVNRQAESLKSVEKDIDEIQEDVEDLQEDDEEEEIDEQKTKVSLEKIEIGLQKLLNEVEDLKKRNTERSL